MAQAMKGVSRAMANMNRQMNMPQIQQILHEFEKQSEIMDMKEEMINDAIDDAMEDEGDEEESDAVVAQVLDELGLQLNDQLSGLPQVISINPLNHLILTFQLPKRHPDPSQSQESSNRKQLPLELVVVAVELLLQPPSPMLTMNFRSALITSVGNKLSFVYIKLNFFW
jgi:hypothetical protein